MNYSSTAAIVLADLLPERGHALADCLGKKQHKGGSPKIMRTKTGCLFPGMNRSNSVLYVGD